MRIASLSVRVSEEDRAYIDGLKSQNQLGSLLRIYIQALRQDKESVLSYLLGLGRQSISRNDFQDRVAKATLYKEYVQLDLDISFKEWLSELDSVDLVSYTGLSYFNADIVDLIKKDEDIAVKLEKVLSYVSSLKEREGQSLLAYGGLDLNFELDGLGDISGGSSDISLSSLTQSDIVDAVKKAFRELDLSSKLSDNILTVESPSESNDVSESVSEPAVVQSNNSVQESALWGDVVQDDLSQEVSEEIDEDADNSVPSELGFSSGSKPVQELNIAQSKDILAGLGI